MLDIGLYYLTLDRRSDTLSGGEVQRIQLATQIGTGLIGACYVLDEPTIGLHQRDNKRLIDTLKKLKDSGNTVIVVEHDEETIRNADYVIDLGPGAGEHGGEVVAKGSIPEIISNKESLTSQYLNHKFKVEIPGTRKIADMKNVILIKGARENNLKSINVSIPLKVFCCITGVSGSGKSTIANLFTRFYDVDSGSIELDGHDIRDYELRNLREHFALVSQNVHLFNDSVANNIAYAAEEKYSREQIEHAAKLAHACEFIEGMENGIDTVVGENGASLSGGQRQRIAIARALLRDAPVLILDEATSALDTESERAIQSALEELQKDKTVLVIAHRLSTIEQADEILVVDDGHIVERGAHAELIAHDGAYAQLHRIQFSG